MRRRPDVECHLKRAVGVECVLLLESFVIAVRLRDRDVHVDAPCRAIRVGFGGDPDHTVRQEYGMAYGAAVAAGSIDYLRGHLANSHRAVRRRVEVGGAGRGVRYNDVGHGGLLRWLTAAHTARLSTVEEVAENRPSAHTSQRLKRRRQQSFFGGLSCHFCAIGLDFSGKNFFDKGIKLMLDCYWIRYLLFHNGLPSFRAISL